MSVGSQSIELPTGDTVKYTVEHRDVKYPRITLNPDGTLKVIVSQNAPIISLLQNQLDWIASEYNRQIEDLSAITAEYGELTKGFTLWGSSYSLQINDGQYDIHFENDRLILTTPSGQDAHSYLGNQVREALQTAIESIANSYCEKIEKEYTSLTIRNQRTKWGSCSSGSKLNFNIRCAFLPLTHIEYLVAHEVTHLKYPNHPDRFWEVVESLVPEYESLQQQLQGFWYAIHRNATWCKLLSL